MTETLFDRVGGFAKVSRIVSAFYEKVLESPILAPYFANVDMRHLIDHQTKFFAFLMGGPASYSDEHLERVHAHLGITEQAFHESAGLLRETLEDFEMDESDIAIVHNEFTMRKNVIVVRPKTEAT